MVYTVLELFLHILHELILDQHTKSKQIKPLHETLKYFVIPCSNNASEERFENMANGSENMFIFWIPKAML